MRVFEWRRHFWGEEEEEELELELECTEEQKTEKAFPKKRERGGGGVGLREEEDEEDDDEQQQQQQPWRGTKKKRTCVSMILSVLMCFSLSVSFFFPFVSPQLCRFVYILLRLCL